MVLKIFYLSRFEYHQNWLNILMDVSHMSNITKLKKKKEKKIKKKKLLAACLNTKKKKKKQKKTLEKENWGKTCSSPEELYLTFAVDANKQTKLCCCFVEDDDKEEEEEEEEKGDSCFSSIAGSFQSFIWFAVNFLWWSLCSFFVRWRWSFLLPFAFVFCLFVCLFVWLWRFCEFSVVCLFSALFSESRLEGENVLCKDLVAGGRRGKDFSFGISFVRRFLENRERRIEWDRDRDARENGIDCG